MSQLLGSNRQREGFNTIRKDCLESVGYRTAEENHQGEWGKAGRKKQKMCVHWPAVCFHERTDAAHTAGSQWQVHTLSISVPPWTQPVPRTRDTKNPLEKLQTSQVQEETFKCYFIFDLFLYF